MSAREPTRPEGNESTRGLEIGVGPAARTRRLARKELLANPPQQPLQQSPESAWNAVLATQTDADAHATANRGVDAEWRFAMSPRFIDPEQLEELQQRPPISFVVQNATSALVSDGKRKESSQKEDAVMDASSTRTASANAPPTRSAEPRGATLRTRQSWHSPVHVPLPHRKLVTAPTIFGGVAPFPPVLPHPPSSSAKGDANRKHKIAHDSPRGIHKLAKLSPKSNQTQSASERFADRAHIQSLRDKNKEMYDRLVKRFRALKRAEAPPTDGVGGSDPSGLVPTRRDEKDGAPSVESVEDAILFFLSEKRKHDILYFKQRSKCSGVQPPIDSSGRFSLKLSGFTGSDANLIDPSLRYMPYDLERIDSALKAGSGDYYIMSSSSLVHHPNSSGNDMIGEAIPISQWVLESKMFSLLLAGTPLFQKFLVRKVFVWWAMETRQRIYRHLRKRIHRSLPIARSSFVRPMLHSYDALRKIQAIRALSLPPRRMSAASLSAVQDHHKQLLSVTETSLIDAKEELLSVMDAMVAKIQTDLDPPTDIDELYNAEATSIHMSNSKWKSAPISSLRRRQVALQQQKETAKLDRSLLERYIRVMEYMFTESVYLMIIGCVKHLATDLSAEANSGAICASVAISGDALVLSPSHPELKQVLLEGIARLIRLATNFHFTKNAMAWSKNRGTGSLALVASSFESGTQSSQFDLQNVLRKDASFDDATRELLGELARWFEEASRQMTAFECVKTIYASIYSIRSSAKNAQTLVAGSPGSSLNVAPQPLVEITKITGVSGSELARYLKSITCRFDLLDRSQHACQKIQSSWKVGFLELQCRRSISEIFDLITRERDSLHQTLCRLTAEGVSECVSGLQRATLVFDDRPQLIELFCEQLKQVRSLKDGEKQLHQDIRNVDEAARALRRYAPALASDGSLNVLHTLFGKYSSTMQSHAKFAAKMVPAITQQVNSALSRYSARVQRLLRMYEEFASISTEDELERNLAMFQDIARELHAIGDAAALYQEYQKMVGLKLVEIPMLLETTNKWEEVQQVVRFAVQWRATVNSMENGIFSEQKWNLHTETLEAFLPQIQELQQQKDLIFAARLVENLRTSIVGYLHKLGLVAELAQAHMKAHHWHQVLALLDAVNFVSSTGVLVTDGSTLTLGFLRSRHLWDFESQIREITRKAKNDFVTEKKLEEMKRRLLQAMLPLLRTGDYYEIDTATAVQLLGSFEDDLLTVQALGQITTSLQLHASLMQWADEISHYQEVLDLWISAQHDWTRLALVFCLHDVQQSVSDAALEFQSIDRKWKAMMNAARSASSLTICLREVISLAFLNNARLTFEKLWKQLNGYLREKRRVFPRFNFLSDDDLLQLIAGARHPPKLSQLISKCFRNIHSLRIASSVGPGSGSQRKSETETQPSDSTVRGSLLAVIEEASKESDGHTAATPGHLPIPHALSQPDLCHIEGVNGATTAGETLSIKPLHISSSPEIWMKDLWDRIQQTMRESVAIAMRGALVDAFEGNFEELVKYRDQNQKKRRNSSSIRCSTTTGAPQSETAPTLPEHPNASKDSPHRRFWDDLPLQVVVLCMNILLTNELTTLVNVDRNGAGWKLFWLSFYKKKVSLVDFIRRRDCTSHDRMVATTLLTWLLNKSPGIQELYEDHPRSVESDVDAHPLRYREGSDSSSYRCNYSSSHSFAWVKMMRFYYEPCENRCVIHHSVKTFEYGFAYLGGYRCPVLTPLCDRVLLKMSTALSLEVGCLLHTNSSGGQSGKRTMVKELAAAIGVECVDYDCAIAIGSSQFRRMLRGALQSDSCWLCLSGLEVRGCKEEDASFSLVRAFALEMNRLKDAVHARQETFPFDGEQIGILNPNLGIMITSHLDFSEPDHQELLLQLSCSFVPVSCVRPEQELVWETVLHASGMQHWKALSKKLAMLFVLVENHPDPFADIPFCSLRLVFAVANSIVKQQHAAKYVESEEKCVLVALLEEVRSKILPEKRVAFLKAVRAVFPLALDLEYTSLGTLQTRVDAVERKLSSEKDEKDERKSPRPRTRETVDAPNPQSSLGDDSDEEQHKSELTFVKDRLATCMTAKHLVPSETILRKLLELYQVASRSVVTVVIGSTMCGKSTAIDILSCVFGSKKPSSVDPAASQDGANLALATRSIPVHRVKTVRLYPTAFQMDDVYGHFKESDGKHWEDGFLTHFLRSNCDTSSAASFQRIASSENEQPPTSAATTASQPVSRRLSHRGSLAIAKIGGGILDLEPVATSRSAASMPPWLVVDGVRDSSCMLEPLMTLARVSPDGIPRLMLPNGDQLRCENLDMRIFCEIESLQQWSPSCLSHFGLVYFEADHVLPYTLLIKSWTLKQISQITKPENSKHATERFHIAAKFMRSIVSPLVEICKRNSKPFMEFSATHMVANMLHLLALFLDEMSVCFVDNQDEQEREIKVIVAYASTMSFGLFLQAKGRAEFHTLVMKLVPELANSYPGLFANPSITVYDVGLRFENHRATLFLWEPSILDPAADTTDSFDWQTRISRRSGSAGGKAGRSSDAISAANTAFPSSSVDSSASSAHIYIPTPRTISTTACLAMFGSAKANVFFYGDSAIGKTRILDKVVRELTQRERFVASTLQVSKSITAQEIQSAIETGLSRKLKALYCPGAGTKAFLLVLENLNLETETNASARPCSEMIRQVCDGKGSFVKATKEFAEFKDVVLWSSFSLSPFGYPRLSSRLLRHFHLIWFPDQSDQIFRSILAAFPNQFAARYACDHLMPNLSRIARFPVEMFRSARRRFKPSSSSPLLLFSVTDVIRHFSCMMNISTGATGSVVDLELLSIHFAQQIYRSRVLARGELDTVSSMCHKVGERLTFDPRSIDSIGKSLEYLFADCGDTEGYSRIAYPAAVELFHAGEEKFHWYHKSSTSKEASAPTDDLASSPQSPPIPPSTPQGKAAPSSRSKSRSRSTARSASTASLGGVCVPPSVGAMVSSAPSSLSEQPTAMQQHCSLATVAQESANQERNTTASPLLVQNMLDVYTFLQDGVRNLLLYGSDPSSRHSATKIACGAHCFHFKELAPQVRASDFIDQLKSLVLEIGLKGTPTLVYLDCDYLADDEFDIALETVALRDVPSRFYSSADKARILGDDHQFRRANGLNTSRNPAPHEDLSVSPLDCSSQQPSSSGPSVQHHSAFRDNLRRCLYMALSFSSLEAIYSESLSACVPLSDEFKRRAGGERERAYPQIAADFQCAVIEIHQKSTHFLQSRSEASTRVLSEKTRAFGPVRSHFEEFLRVFKILFVFQKSKLDETVSGIEAVMHKLEEDAAQVRVQLGRELNGEEQWKDAARAVVESAEKLKEFEVMEREAKRSFLLDEQHCAVLQREVEQEREIIQQELAKTLPDLLAATESLSQINKYHITELKSFTSPPHLVRLVMQAVCVLLGAPPTWSEALRILADIRFLERLRHFDRDHVDPSLIDRVKLYLNHPDFSMENMKRASLASTTLCKWVLAIVQYFEVMKKVAPTQKKLEHTQHNFRVIDEVVQTERKKLVDLELRINELRALHARNVRDEEELQRNHDSRVRWTCTVSEFADVLAKWRETVHRRYQRTLASQTELVEHCVIVAALMSYGSGSAAGERSQLLCMWTEAIEKHVRSAAERGRASEDTKAAQSPFGMLRTILKNWAVSGSAMRLELQHAFLAMNVAGQVPLVTNLFLTDQIQQVGSRYPLLFDPLKQASAWLKERCSSMSDSSVSSARTTAPLDHPVSSSTNQRDDCSSGTVATTTALLVLDAGDPMLMSTIEKQVAQKAASLILIENASECEEAALHAIFELLAVLIKKRDEEVTIYFSTASLRTPLTWKPTIWNRLAVINFSPTVEDLEAHFLSHFFAFFAGDELCPEKGWKLHQQQLVAEKVKEKHIFQTFFDNVHSMTDAHGRSGDSEDPIAVIWREERGRRLSCAFDELDMMRTIKEWEEYTAAKSKREQTECALRQLSEHRRDALVFAKRLCALVTAEAKLSSAWDPALHLPLPTIVEYIHECGESGARQRNGECQTLDDSLEGTSGTGPSRHDHAPSSSASTTRLRADQAAEFVVQRYVEKRLTGLPTSLHQLFLFLVAISFAEVDGSEPVDPPVLEHLLTNDLFRGMRASSAKGSIYAGVATVNADDDDTSASLVTKRTAQHVVHLAVSISLMTVVDARRQHRGSVHTAVHAKVSQLDAGVRYAYLKVQRAFTSKTAQPALRRKFRLELLEDMLEQRDAWKEYVSHPPSSLLPLSPTASARPFAGRCFPEWIVKALTPLEKLLLHLCLFESVSSSLLNEFIASQLGEKVAKSVFPSTRSSLVSVAKRAVFCTPILLLSHPCLQVSGGLSSLLQCARRMAVREDLLSCMSMGSAADTSVADFHLSEFPHNSLSANVSAMKYQEVVKHLNGIKESSLSGGWMVVKDLEHATLAARNALRQQIESMQHLHASKSNDFRLWLHCELSRRRSRCPDGNAHGDQQMRFLTPSPTSATHEFLARLPVERRFVEFPQTLLQYYTAFQQQEDERNELQQKRQQQQEQQEHVPPHPMLLRRRSSVSAGPSQVAVDPGAEQRWIQPALWIFHMIFRSHLEACNTGRIEQHEQGASTSRAARSSDPTPYPVDLFLSHFELERSIRLLQLHARQKTLATTAAVSDVLPTSSAAAINADCHAMVEFVSMLYMGRQWSDVRARQCHALLEWCFSERNQNHGVSDAVGNEASVHLRNQLVLLREQLVQARLPAAVSSSPIEMAFLPLQLQRAKDTCQTISLLRAMQLTSTVNGEHPSIGRASRGSASKERSSLEAAQQSLRSVLEQFPNKASLSSTIERQRIQRHTSIFEAYQRGAKGVDPHKVAAQSAVDESSWYRALLTHLLEVELPAMERYLKYVWSMSEIILSLSAENHEAATSSTAFYQEISLVLEALSSGCVPRSWREPRSRETSRLAKDQSGYAMPVVLKDWVMWFRQAVGFYRALQTRPKHLVDVVWMPGLQHSKAFLFSFCHKVAEANDLAISELSLSISSRPAPSSKDERARDDNGGEASNYTRAQDSLASIVVSGLYLSNAAWSSELGVLVQQTASMPAPGRYQRLPPLCVHATTHFKPDVAAMLSGGASSTADSERAPQLLHHGSTASSSIASVDLLRQRNDDQFFYKCPLFKSPSQLAALQEPIAYMHMPTDQAASLMTVHGVTLFVTDDTNA